MKKRHRFPGAVLGIITAIFCMLAVPAMAKNIVVEHASGKTEVPANPQKVVVFDLASLDNMRGLDVKTIVGVPKSPLPAYLKQYDDSRYTKVGTLFEPDYEAVAALKPDLIIVGGRSQPKYKELARIAPTIDLTVSADHYLGDFKRNLTALGTIFGKQEKAKEQIAHLEKCIGEVNKLADHTGKGLVILTTGGKISAYGPGSRFGIIHSAFGITPVDPNLSVGKHGQPIAPEFILKTNPDWLFVIDRDAAIGAEGKSASQLLDNAIVNQTKAASEGHIVYLNPEDWYLVGGGFTALHDSIHQIRDVFEGEHHHHH